MGVPLSMCGYERNYHSLLSRKKNSTFYLQAIRPSVGVLFV